MSHLGRLEKFFAVLVALGVLAWVAESLGARAVPGAGFFRFLTYITGFVLLIKLLRISMRRLLWRVRNRMIVLFLFIGVVPLVLVTALVALAGYVLTGQVAVYIATSELDRRAGRLQGAANALVWTLRASRAPQAAEMVNHYLESAAANWPGLQACTRTGVRTILFPSATNLEAPRVALRGFRGVVRRDGKFYLLAYASDASAGSVGSTELESVTAPRAARFSPHLESSVEVMLFQPLTESYLSSLAPGLGRISMFSPRLPRPAPASAEPRAALPDPEYRFDYEVIWGTAPFEIASWSESDGEGNLAQLRIQTRYAAVFRRLFGQRVEVAQGVMVAFLSVGTLFLVVELLSLVTGISITRTVTSSVHQLYEGTQRVNKGNFSHRIQVGGHDQLAELALSFNNMTGSIERLIEESKERERLASELQIAREVQEQLFPKAPPHMRGLEILGVCNAARMVSGDYFDFVKLSEDHLALAIGDVAGKGISGALLMASIQSMLRTQLSAAAGGASGADGGVWRFPTARLVSQLNLQLYQNTSPEKYATFFFGAYDDRHHLLTYTNAGHLPPVVIRNGRPERLAVNGLVVGAFPFATYEQSEIELHSGDLLVAFTDGVSEPENEFAEEFGEARLIELLLRHWRRPPREIIDEVIGAVSQWTGKPELQDDMTLMVARRL